MATNLVVGLLVPGALAWAKLGTAVQVVHPPLRGGEAVILCLSLLLFPLSLLVSSSLDWYLIRAFREGVFGEPVCRANHDDGQTTAYARYWALHRMVCEFICYAAVVALIAIATVIAENHTHSTAGKDILTVIGPLGIAAWSLKELGKLVAALQFVRYPTCGLGEWVNGRNAKVNDIAGFVLDVATHPGVQLIDAPRGHPAKDISIKDNSVPLTQRETIRAVEPPRTLCPNGRCEFWVPDCEVGLRQLTTKPAAEARRAPESDSAADPLLT